MLTMLLHFILGARRSFRRVSFLFNLKHGRALSVKNWSEWTSPADFTLHLAIFDEYVVLMPRLAHRTPTWQQRPADFCTNWHCPALLTYPSVSIRPHSSSILCSTEENMYMSGMRLSPQIPSSLRAFVNGFGDPFFPCETFIVQAAELAYLTLSMECPRSERSRIISSMSSSPQVILGSFLAPSPSQTPRRYGSIGSSLSGYSTGSHIGTRYLYSTPLPSALTRLKSSSMSKVVTVRRGLSAEPYATLLRPALVSTVQRWSAEAKISSPSSNSTRYMGLSNISDSAFTRAGLPSAPNT